MNDEASEDAPVECEIKLAGSKGALRQAEAAVRKAVGGRVEWRTDALVTDYYDTTDRRLSRRGVSFRVRRKNRSYEQTVKAAPSRTAAISTRPEWNVALNGARLDLAALPDDARARMGLVLPGELKKLFTVDVERKKTVIAIESGAAKATVEIAVDRGAVRAGRKRDDILEAEIELVDGAPEAIRADPEVRSAYLGEEEIL